MTKSLAEHPTLPPVRCAPWCVDGDGHPGAYHRSDQFCMSAGARISLSGEGLVESCDGTWRDQYMNVYTLREPGESAHIQLGRGEGATVSLTPSEAVQVAAALLNAVTLAQATAG